MPVRLPKAAKVSGGFPARALRNSCGMTLDFQRKSPQAFTRAARVPTRYWRATRLFFGAVLAPESRPMTAAENTILLLDLDDIAKLYRVSRRHARDVLVKQSGFPDRVPGSSSKIPLWSAEEIQAYVMRRAPQ